MGPNGLARQQSSVPRPLDLSNSRRIPRLAAGHDLHHVRRAAIGAGQLAGLLDAEHLPVGFHGIGRRQGGGRNRLSPPGRD